MIFFLMAFLLLSNSHSYAEKLNIDGIEAMDHISTLSISPATTQYVCAWSGSTSSSPITFTSIDAAGVPTAARHYWYVNGVQEDSISPTSGQTNFLFQVNGRPAGTYVVQCRITHDDGGVHTHLSNEVTVYILAEPSIAIGGPTSGCVGENLTLQAQVGDVPGGYSLLWFLNGVSTGVTTQNYTYTVPATPQNSVVTVRLSYDGCTPKFSPEHHVTNMPDGLIVVNDTWVRCNGSSVTVTADAQNPAGITPTRFRWVGDIYGTGNQIVFTSTNNIEILGSGRFYVTAEYEQAACNTPIDSFDVSVFTPTTLTVTSTVANYCEGSQFTLSTTNLAASYIWYRNGVEIPGENLYTITETDLPAGNYSYAVKAIYTNGCETAVSTPTVISVHAPADVLISGAPMYCASSTTVTLSSSGSIGGSSYLWYVDNVSTGVTTDGITQLAVTAREYPYTYKLRITAPAANGGCVSYVEYPVIVNQTPSVQIASDNMTSCVGGNVVVTPLMGYSTDYTYQWRVNSVNDATTYNLNTSFGSAATRLIDLVVTSTSNPTCSATSNVLSIVTAADPATPSISPINSDLCLGGEVTLSTADVTNGTFRWMRNGVVIEGATTNTLTEILPTEGTYYYTVSVTTPASGCTSLTSAAATVNIFAPVDVNISGIPMYCASSASENLTVIGALPLSTFAWSVDGGAYSVGTATYATGTINAREYPYVYNVRVQAPATAGACISTAQFEVLVNQIPSVQISASDLAPCVNGAVTFTPAMGYSTDYTYQWNLDGTPETNTYIYNTTFTDPGTSTVTLTVTSTSNPTCTATSNILTVVTSAVPTTPSITITDATLCIGGQTTLSVGAVANGVYTWYRNGAVIAGANTNTINEIYPTAGTYTYTVNVRVPGSGCISANATNATVSVSTPANISVTGTPMYCGSSATPTLTVIGATGGSTFLWSLDGATPTSTGTTNTLTPTLTDRDYPYVYSIQATDPATGCVSYAEYSIIVDETPAIQITVSDNAPCENGVITFTPTMPYSTDYTYQWYDGVTLIPGATSYIYNTSYSTDGAHSISLRVTSTSVPTCIANSNALAINVQNPPAAPSITPANSDICLGGEVTLTATAVTGGVYTWYRNGVELTGVNTNVLTEILPTEGLYTYYVNVRVAGENCLSAMSTAAVIEVHAPVVVTISGTPIFCTDPATVSLTSNGDIAGSSYQWYRDNVAVGVSTDDNFSESLPSRDLPYIYRLEVIAPDANGACLSVSADYPVIINDNPEIEIAAEATSVCLGGEIRITPLAPYSQDVTYQWRIVNDATIIASTYELIIPATADASYQLTIISNNVPSCTAVSNVVAIDVVTPSAVTVATSVVIPDNTICDGGQFTLVTTTAATQPQYTWFRNGVLIPGATLATLTESPLSVDQDSTYYTYIVFVTSSEGCLTSDTITLLVKRNPVVEIVTNPNVCASVPTSATNIEVTARINGQSGVIPGTFTWFEDGVQVSGALSTFNVQKATRNYPYQYQLRYSSPFGCIVYSNVVDVMVHPRPVIEVLAQETPICVGGEINLNVNVTNYAVSEEYTYQWYLADTTAVNAIPGANLTTYSTVPTVAGSYNYWIIVDNYAVQAPGTQRVRCEAAEYKTIVVNADPIVSINAPTTPICDGGQVLLIAGTTGGVTGGEVYTWYKNGVVIPGATLDTLIDYPATVDSDTTFYTYKVEVTQTASGCASVNTAETTVMVVRNPIVEIVTNPNVCANVPTSATNIEVVARVNGQSGAIPGTFTWYEDGLQQSGALSTYNVQKPTRNYPYQYQLRYTSPNGCNMYSNVVDIMVHPRPVIEVLAQETPICVGGEINLNVNVTNYAVSEEYTYQWYLADTTAVNAIPGANLTTYSTVPTVAGTYNYWVIVDNYAVQAPGTQRVRCEAAEYKTIVVNADPIISINAPTTPICDGGQVLLIAGTTGGVTGGEVYTWYKNGVVIPGATLDTLIDYPATVDLDTTFYTYKVEVTQTASGCASVNTAETTVMVVRNPIVEIVSNPNVCENVPTSATNIEVIARVNGQSGAIPGTFTWYEDGLQQSGTLSTFNVQKPTRNYPYQYQLRYTSPNGCNMYSNVVDVMVHPRPVIQILAQENPICVGGDINLSVNLTNYAVSEEYTYQWYNVDTTTVNAINGATLPTYHTVPTTPGTYTYWLLVDNYAVHAPNTQRVRCEAAEAITISVVADPVISVAISQDTICEGGEVIVTSTISGTTPGIPGGEVYTWYKNDVIIPGAVSAVLVDYPVTVDQNITNIIYRVEVTQTASGCASVNTATTSVLVHPNPSVQIEGDPIICDQTPISLVSNVNDEYNNPAFSYQWRLFNADIVGATNPTYTQLYADTNNPYIFTVLVTNTNGCQKESAPFYVYVNTAPVVQVTSTETLVCVGGEVTMTTNLADYNSPSLTYQWYTVVGAVETPVFGASEPTLTIIPNVTTTYRVKVFQTTSACLATGDITITVNADPVIAVAISDPVICQGGEVTVTSSITSGGVTGGEVYTWYKNDVIIPGAVSAVLVDYPVTVDNDITNYIYRVEVAQTAAGCASVNTATTSVEVHPNPTVVISGDPIVCVGTNNIALTANINDEYPTSNLDIQWRLFNSDITLANGVNYTGTYAGTDNPWIFTVVVSNPLGCVTTSAPFEVLVNVPPVVELTSNETTVCVGGPITMTANLVDYNAPDLIYRWYTVDGSTETPIYGATESTLTIIPNVTTTYRVRVTQTTSACTDFDDILITVNADPVIAVSISQDTICEGGEVIVTSTVTGGVAGGEVYTWYKNDVIIPGAVSAVLVDYPVTVDQNITNIIYRVEVAQTASGCASVNTATTSVLVHPNPSVQIEGDPIICDQTPISLVSNVNDEYNNPALSYQWRLFNADIVGATNPTYTQLYADTNNPYIFTVLVTNTNGCQRESAPFYVYVNTAPVVQVTSTETLVCVGGEVTMTTNLADYNSPSLTYQWYTVNGSTETPIVGASEPTLTIIPNVTTTYRVKVFQTTSACLATGDITITVNADPVIAVSISEPVICQGGEVTVTSTITSGGVTGGEVYTWYKNDVIIPGAVSAVLVDYPVTVDNDITNYIYRVEVAQTAAGCASVNTATTSVIVHPNPTVVISGDPIVCTGTGNITLHANVNDEYATSNLGIQWRLFNTNLPSATDINYTGTYLASDNPYIFTVVVSNPLGCVTTSAPFEVLVNTPPVVELTSNETTVCVGGPITMTANLVDYNAPDLIYRWYTVNGSTETPVYGATESTLTIIPNVTTTYRVRVTQTTSGCVDQDDILITVNADPVIAVTISQDTICEGGEVIVTSTVTGGVTGGEVYTWYKNNVIIPGAVSAILVDYPVTVDQNITNIIYRVEVAQTASGCASVNTASTSVLVHPNPSVQIEGDPIICDQSAISLVAHVNDEYLNPALTYQWRLFNADIAGATNPTFTQVYPDTDNPYTFTVLTTNSNGCQRESAPFNVYVNTAPVVEVTSTETTICTGGEVTLTTNLADYNSSNLIYQWYIGSQPIAGASEPTLTIIPNGTTTYRVVVTQTTSACVATGEITINVNPDPIITGITISENYICEGGQVTVTASTENVTGTPYFTWYRNGILVDGVNGASFTESPDAIDADVTLYTYSAIVTTNVSGCQSLEVNAPVLTVYGNPVVAIAGDANICEGDSVFLTAFVDHVSDLVGTLTYTWFESGQQLDNNAYGISNPASQFLVDFFAPRYEPYVFTVRVTRENGCTTMSEPFLVYVHAAPVVNITSTEENICEEGVVTLTANLDNYTTDFITYQWYTETYVQYPFYTSATEFYMVTDTVLALIPGATQQLYTTDVDDTTTYVVRVQQTHSLCTDYDRFTVITHAIPTVTSITVTPETSVCSGGQVTLTANISGGVTGGEVYTWYRNGFILPNANTQSITETLLAIDNDNTVYTYNVVVTQNAAACQSILNPAVAVAITVYPNPTVIISGDPVVCATENNIVLTANLQSSIPGLQYTWFEDNMPVGTGAVLTLTRPARDYAYNYQVVVYNSLGCSAVSEEFNVLVNANPVVNVSADLTTICVGGTAHLTAVLSDNNTTNLTYQWYIGTEAIVGATQATLTVNPIATTTYRVVVTQTTSGCVGENSITITVNPDPIIATITVENPTLCEGGQIVVSATTNPEMIDGAVYTWYKNGAVIAGVQGASFTESPIAIDNNVTVYTYSVSVASPVSGCLSNIVTAQQQVTVYGNPTVVIEGNPLVCNDSTFTLIANVNDTIPGTLVTYQWRRFNENIPGATSQTLTTTEPFQFGNTYMYTVVINTEYTNGTIGCIRESEPFYVAVGENPHVDILASDTVACLNGEVTLTAVLGNAYLENIFVTWYKNGQEIYGAHELSYVATITETATYYAVVSASGCTATTEFVEIHLINTPVVGAVIASNNVGGSNICEGGEVEVTAYLFNGTNNYIDSTATYTWYRNGFLMEGVTGPWFRESLHAIDGDTTHYTYAVVVSSESSNCVSPIAYSNTVTVIRNPIVIINGLHHICQSTNGQPNLYLSAYINGISNPDNTTIFKWYKNGVYQNNPNFGLYYTENLGLSYQTVEYMVEIINGNGCSTFSEPFEIFVHPTPVANITVNESTVCAGGSVTLQGHLNDYNEDDYIFQWYLNGTSVANVIPGATDLTYTTPALSTSGTYYFRVIQRHSGCNDLASQVITIVPDPQITNIAVTATAICDGGEVTITATPANITGTPVYTWFRNGILLEGITGPSFTQTLFANGNDVTTYQYTAFVTTNVGGCQSAVASAQLVTVTPNPTVVIAGEPIVCEGQGNIVLNANALPTTGLQYQWFLNNQPIENATASTLTTTQTASTTPYIYTVQVSGATGCLTMSLPFSVTVNASPIVNVMATENAICVGGEVTLTATLVDWNAGMLTYQWYHEGEMIPGATNLTYTTTINGIGAHNYQIVVTQITSGCTGTANTTVTVSADPQITGITISEPYICEGGQVTVTASATGIIGTPVYTWFRNGILMEGVTGASFTESPLAIDEDLTVYTYTAYVTSSASGCQSLIATAPTVTVYGNPVVAISGDNHICENESVVLMAFVDHVSDNVGNLTYTWFEHGQQRDNMVNGIPANSQYYTEYWYPNDQAYVFTVRVTRENGCTTLSQPFLVTVHENPVVNVTATEETVCVGGQVTMTANLNNYNTEDITYQWFTVTTQENQVQVSATEFITVIDTIINNIPGATLQNYSTVVNATSQYGVLVTQTNSGCTATDEITITTNPLPVVTGITITPTNTVCEGGQVTLTAAIQGGVAGGEVYTWYRNGVIIPGANTASITESPVTVDGNVTIYTYNVTVAQTASACQSVLNNDVAVQVTVNPNPSVTISGDPIICVTNNIQLMANLNDVNNNTGMTYEWRLFNQSLGITTPELSISRPSSDNPYIFTVLVTNQYGCQVESAPYNVYVNANPTVQVTATEATICAGGTTTLTANLGDYNVPNLVFSWTENGTVIPGATTNQITVNPASTSIYAVSIVQTTSECTATGSFTVTVVPDPVISNVTISQTQVCEGGQVTLNATIEGGIQGGELFTWFRNGVIIPNITGSSFTESPLVIGDDITIYNYTVQITQTASGCQSVISQPVSVTVYPLATVQIMVTGNTTICEGGNTLLTANVNPTTTNTTYQWFVDNVLIPGATSQTYTVADAQARQTAYQYTVLISQYIGCNVTSAPQAITVVADPVVNITINNPSVCVGGTATLTANVEGGVENINGIGAYTFNWFSTTSPNTSIGTQATLDVIGTIPQLETYWVVVTSPYGCATTAYYYNFETVADPTVAIAIGSGYSTQVCEGGSTMLVANVQGGIGQVMYQWYKNGILLPGQTNASIMTTALYSNQTADYTVNVTMTGVGCNATANFNAQNIVVASPVVAITGNTNTCPGGTVTLVSAITGGVANDTYTYQWYKVANGIPTAINGATNASYTTSPLLLGDSYEYYVQISSFVSGCSATSGTVQANVVPEPNVSITGANSVCQGGVLTLTANVTGGVAGEAYVYTWTYQQGTNTGTFQTTTNVFQLPTTLVANDVASPYVFTVSVMSANYNCNAISATHTINIYPQPQATITVDHEAVCVGGSVTFTANVTPVGSYNYQWTVNGVVQGNNTSYITRNNLPAGTTNVSVLVTPNYSNAACTATASKQVTIVADPVVTISSNVTAMCTGGTINLGVQNINLSTLVASGDYTYQWRENGVQVDNVIGNTFSKNLATAGTYTYALRIAQSDNLGCASNWSNEITVNVAPQPVVTINPAGLGLLDICSGGEVNLNANVTNATPVQGTMTYTWFSNNTNTGITTNPYNQTLNNVGTYNYYAIVTPSGYACAPVNSNTITYHVVADPTWTNVSVMYPVICEGESVQLSAGVQGGVLDGSQNTSGTIHWTVWAEGGNAQPVLGGIGGNSYDTPAGTGNYFYQPVYSGQLGDGCNILVNPVTPVVVNERPTATFVGGDGSIVCGNDPNSFATLTVQLTGTAPFTFTLNGSNGFTQNFSTSLNTFYIYLNPTSTASYSITNLEDANCTAVEYPAPVSVVVSHIAILDLLAEVCGESGETLPKVQIDVNIYSVAPGVTPTAYITFANPNLPEMNTQSAVITEGARTYIEFSVPSVPGDYQVIITIDGCDYPATVRVLAGQYNFGGTDALVQQRWDDVVVVNNNPLTNGGYNFVSFQWYKNGVVIPGATNQYYQEVGGLNGEYAVMLVAETTNGLVTFKTCDMFFVSENLMKVYPVPARTQESITIEVKLSSEQLDGAILDIYDAKGAFIKQVEVNDIITRIDGFTVPGVYFGRITTGTNEIKTVKFVIVK